MDCLRSVLPLPGIPVVVGPVLEGLAGGVDCVPPKKSKPSRLSPGRVCFGGATVPRGGPGRLSEGSAVLGLAGPDGSPNKSTSCGLVLGACNGPTGALPFLTLFPRALSCTTFNGTSSSFASPSWSKLDGSDGTGPSMAHRRESYFVRMKFSILLSLGT